MKRIFIFLFITILLFNFISAVKPVSNVNLGQEGYIIEPTQKSAIRYNMDHEFEVHVFNISTGYPITSGVSCYLHIYQEDGDHIYIGETNTVEHLFDYTFNVPASNFSMRGEYQAKFQCNNSRLGGGAEIYFIVNDIGEELDTAHSIKFNFAMMFLMILFIMALIGLFSFENPSGKLACYWVAHLLFITGTFSVWQFNLGYTTKFVGLAGVWKVLFYVSIFSAFPMLILSLAWIFYIHTMNDDIKNMMERGMDENEAISRAKANRRNRRRR